VEVRALASFAVFARRQVSNPLGEFGSDLRIVSINCPTEAFDKTLEVFGPEVAFFREVVIVVGECEEAVVRPFARLELGAVRPLGGEVGAASQAGSAWEF